MTARFSRQGQQVDEELAAWGDTACHCMLADQTEPELLGVGHVAREVYEVRVVLDVGAGQFACPAKDADRDVDDLAGVAARQFGEQVAGELEA
jgi:hypothetical protein